MVCADLSQAAARLRVVGVDRLGHPDDGRASMAEGHELDRLLIGQDELS
jgi:hypothetical protein